MKLRALINVFNVWPDFLQPLFSENDDFYFQKQKDRIIIDFQRGFTKDLFENGHVINVENGITRKIGDYAIIAVGFSSNDYIVGTIDEVLSDYYNQPEKYFLDEKFFEEFLRFVKKYSYPRIPDNIKNNTLDSYKNVLTETLKLYISKINNVFIDNLELNYYYNENYIMASPQIGIEINDIYAFRKMICSDSLFFKNKFCLLYKKRTNIERIIPFQYQIEIINNIIYESPYRTKLFEIQKTMSNNKYLWSNQDLYCYFRKKACVGKYKNIIKRNLSYYYSSFLKEWRIVVPEPLFNIALQLNNNELFDCFIEKIKEDAFEEDGVIMLFATHILSKTANVNMLVTQHYDKQRKWNFCILEHAVVFEDVVDYINRLYDEYQKKLFLIIENDSIIDEKMTEWLQENTSRCSITALPLNYGIMHFSPN